MTCVKKIQFSWEHSRKAPLYPSNHVLDKTKVASLGRFLVYPLALLRFAFNLGSQVCISKSWMRDSQRVWSFNKYGSLELSFKNDDFPFKRHFFWYLKGKSSFLNDISSLKYFPDDQTFWESLSNFLSGTIDYPGLCELEHRVSSPRTDLKLTKLYVHMWILLRYNQTS